MSEIKKIELKLQDSEHCDGCIFLHSNGLYASCRLYKGYHPEITGEIDSSYPIHVRSRECIEDCYDEKAEKLKLVERIVKDYMSIAITPVIMRERSVDYQYTLNNHDGLLKILSTLKSEIEQDLKNESRKK